MKQKATLKAIASFLPAGKLTNEQLAEQFGGLDAVQMTEKTGISVRSVASAEECASDLGVAAAQRLFETGACLPEEIDFLLLCTQSPDYFLPTTACLIQDRLGLRIDSGALDFNLGCSGYVYGLALAKSLIEAGTAANVLLITSDTYTKYINRRDRSLRTLFGDGATASLIGAIETENEPIGPFVFGTDGGGANELILPAGGLRCPATPETAIELQDESGNWRSQQNLYMNGGEVFNFTLRTIPQTLTRLLEKAGLTLDQIDYLVPHQANKFMLERLRSKLKITAERFCIDMENCGNTVSSTIPMALEGAMRRGRVKSGDRVVLIGFGVGYSWGATIIRAS